MNNFTVILLHSKCVNIKAKAFLINNDCFQFYDITGLLIAAFPIEQVISCIKQDN